MEDRILFGKGYTVRDSLRYVIFTPCVPPSTLYFMLIVFLIHFRPLSYSTLADLIHHLRSELNLTKMARAIDLFGRNMFDETLPLSIQQMSQRLIFNLAECIRLRMAESNSIDVSRQHMNPASARRILLQIMYLCVLKCRIVAEHYIPEMEAKW